MKKVIVFLFLGLMGNMAQASQASKKDTSVHHITIVSKKTYPNGDIRIEYADGTYCTLFAYQTGFKK